MRSFVWERCCHGTPAVFPCTETNSALTCRLQFSNNISIEGGFPMKALSLLLSFVLLTGFAVAQRRPTIFPPGRIVDLSYPFDSATVYSPTAQSFQLEKDFEGITDKRYFY